MSVSKNIETVKSIYEAFGRGDVPAILEALHPDVEWEFAASPHAVTIPWLVPGRGKDAVARFFATVGENLRFESFEIIAVMGEGEWVVGLASLAAVHTGTGKRLVERCEPHVWRFDREGRVIAMRHGADTLHHAEVSGLV